MLLKKKMEVIGTKIRVERKKSRLNLAQFAKKVNISPKTLQRIETGKSSPSVVLLSELANHNKFPNKINISRFL